MNIQMFGKSKCFDTKKADRNSRIGGYARAKRREC